MGWERDGNHPAAHPDVSVTMPLVQHPHFCLLWDLPSWSQNFHLSGVLESQLSPPGGKNYAPPCPGLLQSPVFLFLVSVIWGFTYLQLEPKAVGRFPLFSIILFLVILFLLLLLHFPFLISPSLYSPCPPHQPVWLLPLTVN